MFDITRELAALPADPDGVCEVAERFVSEWFGPIADADGCEVGEIEHAERVLGFSLPSALRRIYGTIGRRDDLLRRADAVQEIGKLGVDDDVLVFRQENQRCALWGVQTADLGQAADPPVVWKDPQDDGSHWQHDQDRLSVALLEAIFSESMVSHGRNVLYCEAEEGTIEALSADFVPLPEFEHVFWPIPDGPPIQWFGTTDALLRSDGGIRLWLYARTPAALDAARNLVPGEWEELDA